MKSLTYFLKQPLQIQFSLSNFSLGLFLINCIIDPGNALFHTKQLTFFFALAANMKKMKCDNCFPIFNFVVFYAAFFVSASLMMLRSINYDSDFLNMYSTTFLLLVIFFINNKKINVDFYFNFVCFIIALLTIVFSIIIIMIPAAAIVIMENEKLNTIFMFAEHKKFLWWLISSVFHRASPLLILQVALKFYFFLKNHKKKDFIATAFYLFAMFFTGTRANILASVLAVGLMYLYNLYFVRNKLHKTAFLAVLFCFFAFIAVFLMLTVKNSSSNMKDLHMVSYNILFSGNPSYLLIGQGPGAWFYDVGWKKLCLNTEISYLELVRMFGMFFTIALVLFYAYPFIHFIKKPTFFRFNISIAYLAYLFIAGTNPLLIGPTGFIAFWYANYLLENGGCGNGGHNNGNI